MRCSEPTQPSGVPTLFWMRRNKRQIPGGQWGSEPGYHKPTGNLKAILKSNSILQYPTFIATLKLKIPKSPKKCKLQERLLFPLKYIQARG